MADEHHLLNSWVFWEHRKGGSDYGAKMKELGEPFDTVEGFWRYKNNIPAPGAVFFTAATGQKKFPDRDVEGFSMFKAGIRPEWEDPANMSGGEFFCRQTMSDSMLDNSWEKLLCGLVGETIDIGDEITGARVVDKSKSGKPTYRLEMWFKTRDQAKLEQLKDRLATCLGNNLLKEFMEHNVAMNNHHIGGRRGGSGRNFK